MPAYLGPAGVPQGAEHARQRRLVINRETMEEKLGREWDVQEMLIDVISIGGNVDEDDDHFILQWT